MVNGDLGDNWGVIERFGVDAIPHLALVGSDGVVETALIGPIPRSVLRADLDVLLENSRLDQNAAAGGVVDQSSGSGSNSDSDSEKLQERQGKIELPYKMYDAFRNQPEMRRVSF